MMPAPPGRPKVLALPSGDASQASWGLSAAAPGRSQAAALPSGDASEASWGLSYHVLFAVSHQRRHPLGEALRQLLGGVDRAVLAAGAAQGHGQVGALAVVEGLEPAA